MLIIFPYKMKSESTHTYYCCCWKRDFTNYGPAIVKSTDVPKGVSDLPEEAVEDLGFIIQLMNRSSEYGMYLKYKSSIENISEIAILETH